MSINYIRDHYKVPVKVGGRVRYTGQDGAKHDGIIIGTRGAYLRIRLDGQNSAGNYHPTYNLVYLTPHTTNQEH